MPRALVTGTRLDWQGTVPIFKLRGCTAWHGLVKGYKLNQVNRYLTQDVDNRVPGWGALQTHMDPLWAYGLGLPQYTDH